jgi:hypothetical protein
MPILDYAVKTRTVTSKTKKMMERTEMTTLRRTVEGEKFWPYQKPSY